MSYEVLVYPKDSGVLAKTWQCPCDKCSFYQVSPILLEKLETLELYVGTKVVVVVGYRCQMWWLSHHGVSGGSKCLQGLAARVKVHGMASDRLINEAKKAGLKAEVYGDLVEVSI